MSALLALALALATAPAATEASATAPKPFDYDGYVSSTLAQAEQASCAPERPATTIDATLSPIRFDATATRTLRPIAADAVHVIELRERLAQQPLQVTFAQEVLVRIDGQERWLAIQPQLVPFWLDELADGQKVTLYAMRVGCHLGVEPSVDRLIFAINEFQIEPIGQPEPTP